MKKMFILPATLLILISCRNNADDLAENISDTETEFVKRKEDEKNDSAFKECNNILKDSTVYYLESGIKPPIRDGGHWKR